MTLRLLLSCFAAIAAQTIGLSNAAANDVRVLKDIEFATVDGHSLKLDLYLPNADDPPLVVWIDGGGWRAGSKERCRVSWLTEHGYAVASISYRLTGKALFPAQIHDCKAAVRWLRAHAERYGYEADRIAVGGSSAGGHLALLMGVSGKVEELEGNVGNHLDQLSAVQAIIDYYGPSDFVLRGKTQPDRAYTEKSGSFALLAGLRDGKVKRETEQFASPSTYVTSDDPPLLIFHGDVDRDVLFDQSQRIQQLYKAARLPVTLYVLAGAGHGGKEFYNARQRDLAVEFLDRQMRGEPAKSSE